MKPPPPLNYIHSFECSAGWQVRGDQYCSQWPPSESWSCYDLAIDDELVTFIGASGTEHPARFVPN